MTVHTAYDPVGVAVTDELVTCSEAVTINGSPYWAGYFSELQDEEMKGITNPTYGAWSAVAQGGTRFDVLLKALPTLSTERAVFPADAMLLATVQDAAAYVRYLGRGRSFQSFDIAPLRLGIVKGFLDPTFLGGVGNDIELWREPLLYGNGGIRAIAVSMGTAPTGGTLTFRLHKVAGEGSESEEITVADGTLSKTALFTSRMKFQPGEHAVLTLVGAAALPGTPEDVALVAYPG